MYTYTVRYRCFSEGIFKHSLNQSTKNIPVFCVSDSDTGQQITGTASGTGGAGFTNVKITAHPFSNGDVVIIKKNNEITDGQYTVSSAATNDFDVNFPYSGTPSTQHGICKPTYAIESIQAGAGGNTQINITAQIFSNGDILLVRSNDQIPDGTYTVSNAQVNSFDINYTFTSPSTVHGLVTGVHDIGGPASVTSRTVTPVDESSTDTFSTTLTAYTTIPNTSFTLSEPGRYYCSFSASCNIKTSSTATTVFCAFFNDGTIISATERKLYSITSELQMLIQTQGIINANGGETIDVRIHSSSGETVNVLTRNTNAFRVGS